MSIGGFTRVPGRIAVLIVAVTGLILSVVAANAVYSGVVDRRSAAIERRADDIASVIGHVAITSWAGALGAAIVTATAVAGMNLGMVGALLRERPA